MLSSTTKTFNLLSIGHRAVGKTVFLAGSYTELHSVPHPDSQQQLYFDCVNSAEREKLEQLLNYTTQTSQYPPATIKLTDFHFCLKLKLHRQQNQKTLLHFRLWDLPGELCDLHQEEFQNLAFNSHGCCVFIDAKALIHDNTYPQRFEQTVKQLHAIANLKSRNGSRYAFAIILTKCDKLEANERSQQQIYLRLQPLTNCLEAVKANYQTFCSSIPIVQTQGAATFKPQGAAAPLLWLTWELSQAKHPAWRNNLLKFIAPLLPNLLQQKLAIEERAGFRAFKPPKAVQVKKIQYFCQRTIANWKYTWLLVLVLVSLLGFSGVFFVKKIVNNHQPINRSQMSFLHTGVESKVSFKTSAHHLKFEFYSTSKPKEY